MRRVDDVGISLEEFVDRIADSGSVVRRWPFSHMANDERYITTFSPTDVGLDVPDHAKAFVVGQVAFEDGQPLLNVRATDNYRLHFPDNPPQQGSAWEQVVGVKLALQVALGQGKSESSRNADVLRVLGVEQPLTTPRYQSSNRYARRRGARMSGYIQGTVIEEHGASFRAGIDMGDMSRATLNYPNAQLLSPRGTAADSHLVVGDEIRTRVTRSEYTPTVFRPSKGVVYILKP